MRACVLACVIIMYTQPNYFKVIPYIIDIRRPPYYFIHKSLNVEVELLIVMTAILLMGSHMDTFINTVTALYAK